MKPSISTALMAVMILSAVSVSALAQYVWLDENNHRQYSDQAPPPSVPQDKILKYPDKAKNMHSPSASSPESKPKEPENLADKELAYKKRRDELLAKEKKEADEAKAAAAKSDGCKRLQEYQQSLDSGKRMQRMDANGAHTYMTDEQRAQEKNELGQRMNSECAN